MPRIFDNSDDKLLPELQATLCLADLRSHIFLLQPFLNFDKH